MFKRCVQLTCLCAASLKAGEVRSENSLTCSHWFQFPNYFQEILLVDQLALPFFFLSFFLLYGLPLFFSRLCISTDLGDKITWCFSAGCLFLWHFLISDSRPERKLQPYKAHIDDICKRKPSSYCTFTGNIHCKTGFALIHLPTDVEFQVLQMRLFSFLINIYLLSHFRPCISILFQQKFRNYRTSVSFFKRFCYMNLKNVYFFSCSYTISASGQSNLSFN